MNVTDQTLMATPYSSSSSSTTMEDDDHNDVISSTPCRRDTNCTCKICQASFNATLDLLPMSAQKPSKPSPPETPLFFNPSTVSTPVSETSHFAVSPRVKTTIRTDLKLKFKRKNIGYGFGLLTVKCVLVLCLSFVGKLGFSCVSSRVTRTELSPEIVRKLGEESLGFRDVKEKLGFLNNELLNLVGGSKDCFKIPKWEIVKDGLILRSHCRLYKSGMEEVSIWGWPLQTSGLISTDFGSRSFTILSGRVTEWVNGESSGLIRIANTSWEQGKWSASVWHLDENTWILEYKRSFLFEKTRPFSSVMEFLRFKMTRSFQRVKQLWDFSNANHLAPT